MVRRLKRQKGTVARHDPGQSQKWIAVHVVELSQELPLDQEYRQLDDREPPGVGRERDIEGKDGTRSGVRGPLHTDS